MEKYKNNLPDELKRRRRVSVFLFYLSIAFSVTAIANPKWGKIFAETDYSRGADIIFALDVSRSMDIRDAQINGTQSRLERGLSIAEETATSVSGSRFAAAIGRGKGYLSVPLTWDIETVLSFLETLDASSMTGRSTNLEALLNAAADSFQSSSPAKKIIVFISDGESLDGIIRNAVNRCVKENIIINAIALGSDEGSSVPLADLLQQTDAALLEPAISRRDAAVMRTAAERTGGIYIDGSRDDAPDVLSSNLLSFTQNEKTENNQFESLSPSTQAKSEPKEHRTLFIILAIITFGASKFVPFISSGQYRSQRHNKKQRNSLITLVFILFIFPSCSESKMLLMEANYLHSHGRYSEALVPYFKAVDYDDSAPYAEYGLGLTFYLIGENKTALQHFANSQKKLENYDAAEHSELRYRNSYNSGIVFFEEGDYHSAISAFKTALREDPRKIDAKRNLELSLMSTERQADEKASSGKNQMTAAREILFEYIREEEQQVWKSRKWQAEESFTGADY